jgi:hypothetical protein
MSPDPPPATGAAATSPVAARIAATERLPMERVNAPKPSPTQIVDSVFDFAAQLLNAQRELAHSVLGATTAIGERVQEETEKAAGTATRSTKR